MDTREKESKILKQITETLHGLGFMDRIYDQGSYTEFRIKKACMAIPLLAYGSFLKFETGAKLLEEHLKNKFAFCYTPFSANHGAQIQVTFQPTPLLDLTVVAAPVQHEGEIVPLIKTQWVAFGQGQPDILTIKKYTDILNQAAWVFSEKSAGFLP